MATSFKHNSFPVKLHVILSDPELSTIISWLPHGRSWRIIQHDQFEKIVIPRHFRHRNLASFMRQVNGWGFLRITEGPDRNSYHHEMFLRGRSRLCRQMQRPSKEKVRLARSNLIEGPDFYEMSKKDPLPEEEPRVNSTAFFHQNTSYIDDNNCSLTGNGAFEHVFHSNPNSFLNTRTQGLRNYQVQEILSTPISCMSHPKDLSPLLISNRLGARALNMQQSACSNKDNGMATLEYPIERGESVMNPTDLQLHLIDIKINALAQRRKLWSSLMNI